MKGISFKTLVLFGFLLLMFSNFSVAQEVSVTPTVNVPFDFWVGGTHFPAGDYFVDKTEPSMIIIRSKDNKKIEQAGTILIGDPVNQAHARLILVEINGQIQLAEIWGLLGKRVLTSQYDHPKGDSTRIVQLQYPSNTVSSQLQP